MVKGASSQLFKVLNGDLEADRLNGVLDSEHESIWYRARSRVISALCAVSRADRTTRLYWAVLENIVVTLQLLSFTFSRRNGFPWPEWIDQHFVEYIEYTTLVNFDAGGAVFVTFATLMAGFTLLSVYLVYLADSRATNLQRRLPFVLFNFLGRRIEGILYIPVVLALGRGMICQSCGVVVQVWTGFFLFLFVSYVVGIALTVGDSSPCATSIYRRFHGRPHAICALVKAGLTLGLLVLDSSKWKIALYFILISGVLLSLTFYYWLPFYVSHMNHMYTASHLVFLWSGITLIPQALTTQREPGDFSRVSSGGFGVFTTVIGCIPLIILNTRLLIDYRVGEIKSRNLKSFGSSRQMALRLYLECNLTSESWGTRFDTYRNICEETFPKDAYFNLHVALLLRDLGNNYLLSGQYTRNVKPFKLSLEDSLTLRVLLDTEWETRQSFESNIDYTIFEYHYKNAVEKTFTAMKIITAFWSQYRYYASERYPIKRLARNGKKMRKLIKEISYHLEILLEMDPNSVPVMQLYAAFLKEVLNDKELANELRAKIDLISHEILNDNTERGDQMKNEATCVLSGDVESLGVIVDVNFELCLMFQMSREELIGKKINILCPPPFDEMHDMFLKKYLETQTQFVTLTRRVWGQIATGYVVPLELSVTPKLRKAGEMTLVGIFRPVNDFWKDFIAIDPESMRVLFGSKTMWESILGLDKPLPEKPLSQFIQPHEHDDIQDLVEGSENNTGVDISFANTLMKVRTMKLKYIVPTTRDINITILLFNEKPALELEQTRTKLSLVAVKETPEKAQSNDAKAHLIRKPAVSVTSHSSSSLGGSTTGSKSKRGRSRKSFYKQMMLNLNVTREAANRYRIACCIIFCVCFGPVLFTLFDQKSIITEEIGYVGDLNISVSVSYMLVHATMLVHILQMEQDSGGNKKDSAAVAYLYEMLETDLNTLHDVAKFASTSQNEKLTGAIHSRVVPILEHPSVVLKQETSNTSLWLGTQLYIQYGKDYLRTLSQGTQPNCIDYTGCVFIFNNGPTSLFNASVYASAVRMDLLENTVLTSQMTLGAYFALTAVGFLVMSALLIVRAVLRIQYAQESAVRAAYTLSTVRANEVYKLKKASYETLKNEFRLKLYQNDASDDEDDADNQEPQYPVHSTNFSISHSEMSSELVFRPNGAGDEQCKQVIVDWRPIIRRKATYLLQRTVILMKAVLYSVLILGMPFLLTLAYIVFQEKARERRGKLLLEISNNAYLSAARWVNFGMAVFLANSFHGQDTPSWDYWATQPNGKVNFMVESMKKSQKYHTALVYGDHELGTRGLLYQSLNSNQHQVLFEDSCDTFCQDAVKFIGNRSNTLATSLKIGLHPTFAEITEKFDLHLAAIKDGTVEIMTIDEQIDKTLEVEAIERALERSKALYFKTAVDMLNSEVSYHKNTLLVFSALLLISILVSERLFGRSNKQLLQMQVLLLSVGGDGVFGDLSRPGTRTAKVASS